MMNGFTLRDLAMRGMPPQAQSPLMPTSGAPDLIGPPIQQPPQSPQGWLNAPTQMPTQAGTHPAFLRQPDSFPGQGNGFQGQGNGMMPEHVATLLQMIMSKQR